MSLIDGAGTGSEPSAGRAGLMTVETCKGWPSGALPAASVVACGAAIMPGAAHTTFLPFEQSEPFPQTVPHVPQLFGSLCSSTHVPLHDVSPFVHEH